MSEVGDDYFHEFLRELGDWGRTCDGRPQGTTIIEKQLDFGFGSVPQSVSEEFTRYRSVDTTRLLGGVSNHLSRRT